MTTSPQGKSSSTDAYEHGSPSAWDGVFEGLDLSYTENPVTQGKLFEIVKVGFLEKLLPRPPTNVIEVGCGTAFVSLYIAKRGYATTCVDLNPRILKQAEANFSREGVRGSFVCSEAEDLPFVSGGFDAVTSFGLLEHFKDPVTAIREMVRVIKPGGLFFADIVPSRFSTQTLGSLFNAVATSGYWTLRGKPGLGLKKAGRQFRPEYYENQLGWRAYAKIMEDAGLTNIEVRGNRPFPRLTLSPALDRSYTALLRRAVGPWEKFDASSSSLAKFWGAGWWFWGQKA
jgi:ubiquinone/menaquinone biosynthesis C-methylase UbiE